MPAWITSFVTIPGALFVYWGFRALSQSLQMIDEINIAVAPENQILYYGLGPIMAWRTYQRLFPDKTDLPRCFRKYAIRSAVALAISFAVLLLTTPFIQ